MDTIATRRKSYELPGKLVVRPWQWPNVMERRRPAAAVACRCVGDFLPLPKRCYTQRFRVRARAACAAGQTSVRCRRRRTRMKTLILVNLTNPVRGAKLFKYYIARLQMDHVPFRQPPLLDFLRLESFQTNRGLWRVTSSTQVRFNRRIRGSL